MIKVVVEYKSYFSPGYRNYKMDYKLKPYMGEVTKCKDSRKTVLHKNSKYDIFNFHKFVGKTPEYPL